MMIDGQNLITNMYFAAAMILFVIGLSIMVMDPNLIKKIIGLNIADTAIFLFIVATGYIRGGSAAIAGTGLDRQIFVNPLPSALILTGIVVAVSTTAFALIMIVKLYSYYGTINIDDIAQIRRSRT
jgi:multicomponent Na+:H+ antiporter subunit C